MRNTRFGYTPEFKNTFQNFESRKNTGLYMDNNRRFDRSQNHRIEFQKEEKAKK